MLWSPVTITTSGRRSSKALADDISSLRAVARPDIAGLSLKLNAIVQDVDDLPLLTPEPETAMTSNTLIIPVTVPSRPSSGHSATSV